MNATLIRFFKQFPHSTKTEATRALRQVLRQVALLGLWRTKFFEHAALYGGTALRILYGLNRFSEELDSPYRHRIPISNSIPTSQGLSKSSFGIVSTVSVKKKARQSAIQSAFLKAQTLELLLQTELSEKELQGTGIYEQLKIRIEVDTDPPPQFTTDEAYLLQPLPFSERTFSKPDLFAGKLHVVLCREWSGRVKGRDWWDLLWFIGQDLSVHLGHLEAWMRQTGHYSERGRLTLEELRQRLNRNRQNNTCLIDFQITLPLLPKGRESYGSPG